MELVPLGLLLVGAIPLARAVFANRRTPLVHALLWTLAAWGTWCLTLLFWTNEPVRYIALCLTGCAAVAVLGARRPHAAPWNAVVLGLLAVLLLPFLEGLLLGSETFDSLRVLLLGGVLAMGIVNYLPTRFAAAAMALAVACAGELVLFRVPHPPQRELIELISSICLGLTPWLACIGWQTRGQPALPLDAAWLRFRDRFGLFWTLRVREQFNRAAANAGWPVQLGWRGLRGALDPTIEADVSAALQAILQRFS